MKNYFVILMLILPILLIAKDYKGGGLRYNEDVLYGRFEARIKAPEGKGLLASLFTFNSFSGSDEQWNEIDIEILGRYTDDVQFTTIVPNHVIYENHNRVDFNPQHDFNIYGFEWTPDYIAWFVNGEELHRQTGDHISTLNLSQNVRMNVWVPEYLHWVDEFNPDILPKFAYYDWVSYASYTPDSGSIGTDNNFTPQWKDEMDEFNPDKWTKSDQTWQGNLSDLIPENVVFKDGKMIICLTDAENTGYVDKNPPTLLWAHHQNNKITAYYSEKVDSISASNISNYTVAGANIISVQLLDDGQTVELDVEGISPENSYSLVVFNIKDIAEVPNANSFSIIPLGVAPDPVFPIYVNIGGGAIYDKYLPDQKWEPDREYGYMDGRLQDWNTANDIAGTEEDSLYWFEQYEVVKYKFRVPEGVYSVDLHMAENKYEEVGKRIFNIEIESEMVAENLDLFAVAGFRSAYVVHSNAINVDDGILDIHFTNWTDYPVINGITVNQISTSVDKKKNNIPSKLRLNQNYPNPFNPKTIISYEIPKSSAVKITIFNRLGQKVKTILKQKQGPGKYSVSFDGSGLASGIYFYKLTVDNNLQKSKKMILIQ